jgi:hypothetical protein
MIAFGSSIGETEPYHRYCEPGIRFAAEADSEVYAFAAAGPIARTYNLMLEAAAAREDLEALVLVHSHAEIVDPAFCQKVRQVLSNPEVGVAGGVGATGVRSIAWWEGSVRSGPVRHRYLEHGGGEIPAFSWTRRDPAPGEVDTVDGFLLVLSPWAVRNVRFDESLFLSTGFDLDYCLQVRRSGRRSGTGKSPERRRTTWTGSGAPAAPRPSAKLREQSPTRTRSDMTRACTSSSAPGRSCRAPSPGASPNRFVGPTYGVRSVSGSEDEPT